MLRALYGPLVWAANPDGDMMSNQSNGGQLTLDDAVNPEVLAKLHQCQTASAQVATRFLRLEQEKIQLLAMAKRIDEENNKIFAMLLQERGLPQNTAVDLVDGKLKLQMPPSPEQPAPPADPPPSEAPSESPA